MDINDNIDNTWGISFLELGSIWFIKQHSGLLLSASTVCGLGTCEEPTVTMSVSLIKHSALLES